MKLEHQGPYRLIAEWEKPEAVALVYPGFKKYRNKNAKDDSLNDYGISTIADNYESIIKKLTQSKDKGMMSNVYLIKGNSDDNLDPIYENESIKRYVLPDISDIWIKDFAPLPARDSQGKPVYIKAIYKPKYLLQSEAKSQHKAGCQLSEIFKRHMIDLPLKWDIGNFTHNGRGTGIVTNRLLEDNSELSLKDIKTLFKSILGIDNLIIIDEEPEDETGHVDGTARFISDGTIAIAHYPVSLKAENRYIALVKKAILAENNAFKFVDVPNGILLDEKTDDMDSVFGNHINFLRAGNFVFVPVYNIPSDITAIKVLKKYIHGSQIILVKISALSHYGGALNCMTWSVY